MNQRQTRFIHEFLVDGNGTAAAIRAGFASAGAHVTANRLLRNPKVAAAVEAGQRRLERQLEIDRNLVVRELQGAIDLAREKGDPHAMIAGWREIAKICGYYAPERKTIAVSLAAKRLVQELEALSDAELLELIEGPRVGGGPV